MKTTHPTATHGMHPRSAGTRRTGSLLLRGLSAIVIAVSVTAIPVSTASAAEGYMLMQTEFDLGKKPRFRQLNLAYQGNFSTTSTFWLGQKKQRSIAIPLWGTTPGAPGLLNHLEEQVEQKEKVTLGSAAMTVLGVGLVGAYIYGTVRCIKEAFEYDFYDDSAENRCR